MKKILLVAGREFIATVSTKAFVIGLLLMPAMIGVSIVVFPRLLNPRSFKTQGEIAVIDASGRAIADIRSAFAPEQMVKRREQQVRQALNQAPAAVQELTRARATPQLAAAMVNVGTVSDLSLIELARDTDVQKEKSWLLQSAARRHLALVVVHADAVDSSDGKTFGTYDTYVPANSDDRAMNEIHAAMQEALVNARTRAEGLDRAQIESLVHVERGKSVTVTKDSEHARVGGINQVLPIFFVVLMFMGVMTGGQSLLASTVEEKSNRVMEVLLSALSPLELLAGKLIGQFGVSLIVLGLYIGIGLAVLLSFALFGLINPWLIPYLGIFFVLSYLTYGSLMVSVGAVVNDMREAQSLMMPLMLVLTFPFWVWFPISQNPNSTFATVVSFVPPVNDFAMLIRMASTSPPPLWQVWISIGIGAAGVVASLWFAGKIFKIGLLMYGKPPNIATLIRWARQS